ncbi:MAG TPA: hypothetical protein VHC69_08420 [Polyangiaceae bacterium]|nr:hypothetical protein [Polyangiaceae bacterium]
MVAALPIQRLTHADIADDVALARSVGWQDVEGDRKVIHDAALVMGIRREGTLIAQGALGVYDRAGTIAKMIVAPAFQRQGLAPPRVIPLVHPEQAETPNGLSDNLGVVVITRQASQNCRTAAL